MIMKQYIITNQTVTGSYVQGGRIIKSVLHQGCTNLMIQQNLESNHNKVRTF